MTETRFTKDHEYIRIEGDTGTVGITDYAQGQLGDVVLSSCPRSARRFAKGGEAAVVESVKAASEVYAPVSGEVVGVNADLEGAPGTVNEDPAGEGWFLKLKRRRPAELDGLMTEDAVPGLRRSDPTSRHPGRGRLAAGRCATFVPASPTRRPRRHARAASASTDIDDLFADVPAQAPAAGAARPAARARASSRSSASARPPGGQKRRRRRRCRSSSAPAPTSTMSRRRWTT